MMEPELRTLLERNQHIFGQIFPQKSRVLPNQADRFILKFIILARIQQKTYLL